MVAPPISSNVIYPSDLQEQYRQGNKDFNRLAKCLNSGDLAGAQKAFVAFELDIQNIQQAQNAWHTRQPQHPCEQIEETQATSSKGTYIDVMA